VILVDTSVWVDHLHTGEPALAKLLEAGRVLVHPFVLGELACGRLKNLETVLSLLGALPTAPRSTDEEVLRFIEQRQLMGRGIGYVDVHLLVAAVLADGASLWTRDKRLLATAVALDVAAAGVDLHL
jgi:predicted nucleic acid-binding protein